MDKVRVKIIDPTIIDCEVVPAGQVVSVSEKDGKALVALGQAVLAPEADGEVADQSALPGDNDQVAPPVKEPTPEDDPGDLLNGSPADAMSAEAEPAAKGKKGKGKK